MNTYLKIFLIYAIPLSIYGAILYYGDRKEKAREQLIITLQDSLREQHHQLEVQQLKDSLTIYREWFYQSVE